MASRAWFAVATVLIGVTFSRFFAGTSFTQDDFVWLCFCKFYPNPVEIFWRDTLCGQFFRPLGELWYLTVYSLAGRELIAYQVAYLAIHLVNALLLGTLTERFVSPRAGASVGLWFAINPLFISPISNYYCYCFDTLGFLFYLASLLCLTAVFSRRVWIAGATSLCCAVAAYFSKEAFFTLPGAILLIAGLPGRDEPWQLATLKRRQAWVWLHVALWVAALAWRWVVIGRIGGYGLASVRSPADLLAHATDRLSLFVGFAGWSLAPHLACWNRTIFWPIGVSAVLLLALTAANVRIRRAPRALWLWTWIAITWTPSVLMTTFAPVSWYACLFGCILLLARPLAQFRWGRWGALLIAGYYALFGFSFYAERIPGVTRLRQEVEALNRRFPDGGWREPAGDRIILLRSSFDLYPDPIIKYETPPGRPPAGVLFLSGTSRINWVVTSPAGPGEISPLGVSTMFQNGFMDMGPYRAYPLEYPQRRDDVLRRGPPFRFFQWDGQAEWREVTGQNPYLGPRQSAEANLK
jgi:hypothetical protein